MLERSQIGIGLSLIILAGVIIVIVYVRMIKRNTDRWNQNHPQSDLNKILDAIEGGRKNVTSNHDQVIAEVYGIRATVNRIAAKVEKWFRS